MTRCTPTGGAVRWARPRPSGGVWCITDAGSANLPPGVGAPPWWCRQCHPDSTHTVDHQQERIATYLRKDALIRYYSLGYKKLKTIDNFPITRRRPIRHPNRCLRAAVKQLHLRTVQLHPGNIRYFIYWGQWDRQARDKAPLKIKAGASLLATTHEQFPDSDWPQADRGAQTALYLFSLS